MDNYNALYARDNHKLIINLTAIDSNHAQAQAVDAARALDCETFNLLYGGSFKNHYLLSSLFKSLAFNEFSYKQCAPWKQTASNKNPCLYLFGKRYYVRPLILKYLDIDKTNYVTKMTCDNPACINPYHFEYVAGKNSKLTSGDEKLLVAFIRDGVGVPEIAKALKVHRSTIYRKLSNERFCSGTSN